MERPEANEVLRLGANAAFWREIDGQIVALESERSLYLSTNAAGTLLWRTLERGATRAALAAALADRYALPTDIAERDVDAFLDQLRAQALLES